MNPSSAPRNWRVAQCAVFLAGLVLWGLLWFNADLGLRLFWNLLIPLAPALIVLRTGIWRNVCPLATVALLPRHAGWSRQLRISPRWQGHLQVTGLFLLLSVVPLRHVSFDRDGHATALLLTASGLMAFAAGLLFDWKSGWCNGLCPVLPVEKLYGTRTAAPVENARCSSCAGCTVTCADSTPGITPHAGAKTPWSRLAASVLTGGFPGFVAGWSLVADSPGTPAPGAMAHAFTHPLSGMAISLALYFAMAIAFPAHETLRRRGFATAAVVIYYWFRIPALMGFGVHPQDGVLVDLRGIVPTFLPEFLRIGASALLIWWLLFRQTSTQPWSPRPAGQR